MDSLQALGASPILQGIAGSFQGTLLGQQHIMSGEVEEGRNAPTSVIFQSDRCSTTMGFAGWTFGISNAILLPAGFITLAVIGGAYYLVATSTNQTIKCLANFFTDCITPLITVANIITTFAIFYMGFTLVGTCVLTMYGLALLNGAGYLPECVQKIYNHVLLNQYVLLVGGILFSTGIKQIFSIILLAAKGAMLVEKYLFPVDRVQRSLLDANAPGTLTPQQFIEILTTDRVRFEINRAAVYKIVPDYRVPTPNIDYETVLLGLFDEKRARLAPVIARKVTHDLRYQHENDRSRVDPTSFARASLQTLLRHVKNRDFGGGVSVDYDDLEKKLKIQAQYLNEHKDDQATFVDDNMITLAIEGGAYCQAAGAPIIRQVYREVVFKTLMSSGVVSEQSKVKLLFYQTLSNFREKIFQRILQSLSTEDEGAESSSTRSQEPPSQLLTFYWEVVSDRHMHNQLKVAYGDDLGLPSTGEEDDVVAQTAGHDPFLWCMNKLFGFYVRCSTGQSIEAKDLMKLLFFSQIYTPDRVVGYLRESTSFENRRSSDNIVPWITGWINSRTEFTAQQKQQMVNQLSDDYAITINGRRITLRDRDHRLFQAMAVDTEILSITPNSG